MPKFCLILIIISETLNFSDILVIPHNNFIIDILNIPYILDIPHTHHDFTYNLEKLKVAKLRPNQSKVGIKSVSDYLPQSYPPTYQSGVATLFQGTVFQGTLFQGTLFQGDIVATLCQGTLFSNVSLRTVSPWNTVFLEQCLLGTKSHIPIH